MENRPMTVLEQARAAVNRRVALDHERWMEEMRHRREEEKRNLLNGSYLPNCSCDICLTGILDLTSATCGSPRMPIRSPLPDRGRRAPIAPIAPASVSVVFSPVVDVPID